MKFVAITSFKESCSDGQIKKIYNDIKRKHPKGFERCHLTRIPSLTRLITRTWGWQAEADYTMLLNRLKDANAISFNHVTRKWEYLSDVSSLTGAELVIQNIRDLEKQLGSLGYVRKQRAVYEKTETVSVTI